MADFWLNYDWVYNNVGSVFLMHAMFIDKDEYIDGFAIWSPSKQYFSHIKTKWLQRSQNFLDSCSIPISQRTNGPVMLTWHPVLGRERDFWQHFKAFIISIILYQFQKDPFCLIILYDILFYFIHVYIAPGQGKTTLGDNFFDHFDHWSHVSKKYLCPLILCTSFHDFIHVYSPGRGRQPTAGKILLSAERPHHFGHLLQVSNKSLQPLLYTSFHDLAVGQG